MPPYRAGNGICRVCCSEGEISEKRAIGSYKMAAFTISAHVMLERTLVIVGRECIRPKKRTRAFSKAVSVDNTGVANVRESELRHSVQVTSNTESIAKEYTKQGLSTMPLPQA